MKTYLIVDGNYLLNRIVFSLHKSNNLELLSDVLWQFITVRLKTFKFNKIFFVSDTRLYWRKNIYSLYKSNRRRDKSLDWDWIYEQYSLIKNRLEFEYQNLLVCEEQGLEGDDWIASIVEMANLDQHSTVILSNDSDLHQLIRCDLVQGFINLMAKDLVGNSLIYVPENFDNYIEFVAQKLKTMTAYDFEPGFQELNKCVNQLKHKHDVVLVDGAKSLFTKILCGDRNSDNIPPVYQVMSEDPVNRSIGKRGAEILYYKYVNIHGQLNVLDGDFPLKVADLILDYKKVKELNDDFQVNLQRNINLICLNPQQFPDDLRVKIENCLLDFK